MAARVVVTMGCSADAVGPVAWRGDAREWALADPADQSLDDVRTIRDAIRRHVDALLDEIGGDGATD